MDTPLPTSVPRLMDRLRPSSHPALIWYGQDGERVELSGRVLDNWAAKTANLWVDELDLQAGDVVALGDEVHWRSLAVGLGTWTMGGALRPVAPSGAPRAAGAAPGAATAHPSMHNVSHPQYGGAHHAPAPFADAP